MTQEADLDGAVRMRIRGLRLSLGWSLDDLAARCFLSPSTLSRIETGGRRIALDQLVGIAKALGTTLDQLVETVDDDDVVIRPHSDKRRSMTTWALSRDPTGTTVSKVRFARPVSKRSVDLRVHPGRGWFMVLSGTVSLRLADRTVLVQQGEAAEFSTMTPHTFGAYQGPAEVLAIFDRSGDLSHLHP